MIYKYFNDESINIFEVVKNKNFTLKTYEQDINI